MQHNFLPIRPHPRAFDRDPGYPTRQTLPCAQSALVDWKQGRNVSQAFANLNGKDPDCPRTCMENVKPETSHERGITTTAPRFDPADPETWSAKSPPFLFNGVLYPTHTRMSSRDESSGDESPEEKTVQSKLHKWGQLRQQAFPSSPKEQANLAHSINDSHRTKRSMAPSPELNLERVRSASSSYPLEGIVSTRIQSPISVLGENRLSLSELSQFGGATDPLSSLRTSSSSSRPRSVSASNSTEQAIAEAAAVITAWQSEREPVASYHRYELPDSNEDLLRATSPRRDVSSNNTRSSCRSNPPRYSDVSQYDYHKTMGIQSEADGARETSQGDSPSPLARPQTWPKGAKRKASQFSLGSFTKPLTKRARLGIRRLASSAYRRGSREFSRFREKIRRHEEETRRHAAWKAKCRSRKQRGDSRGTAMWVFADNGHNGWWKEGVKKFHAPSWMHFEPFDWWSGQMERR